MKFTGFKVVPAICVDFSDEGKLYYSIAEDQDADMLQRAFEAMQQGLGELPEDLQLVWAELETGSVAVREVGDERDETPVSGDFFGSGSIIEATYELDGQAHAFELISGDADDRIEQMCAGLNALLDGHRQAMLKAAAGLRSKAAVVRNPMSAAYHDPAQILETAACELEATC